MNALLYEIGIESTVIVFMLGWIGYLLAKILDKLGD